MIKDKQEYVLCAAVWYDNVDYQMVHGVKNKKHGIVFSGWRHASCFQLAKIMLYDKYQSEDNQEKIRLHFVKNNVQGFLTSKNRFVDRVEAAKIAYKSGQTKDQKIELYSEDLY